MLMLEGGCAATPAERGQSFGRAAHPRDHPLQLTKPWRLQGEVMPASETDLDCWSAADKFPVVLETIGGTLVTSAPTAGRRLCFRER